MAAVCVFAQLLATLIETIRIQIIEAVSDSVAVADLHGEVIDEMPGLHQSDPTFAYHTPKSQGDRKRMINSLNGIV
jgi:hypothetical protein